MRTKAAPLQAPALAKLPPGTYRDGPTALMFIVRTTSRLWRVRYWLAGKDQLLSLGKYPAISLAKARELCVSAVEQVALGVKPISPKARARATRQEKQAVTKATQAELASTCGALFREWANRNRNVWSPATMLKFEKVTKRHVLPMFEPVLITAVTPQILMAHLDTIVEKGLYETAVRVRTFFSQVFRFAIVTGRAQVDHAHPLRGLYSVPDREHQKTIPPAEIGELVRALRTYAGEPRVRLAFEFLLLTAVRTIEVRGARWAEFDLERGLWTVPAARMKMRRDHVVPLSQRALEILGEARQHCGQSAYVFPGQKSTKTLSENTLSLALRRIGFDGRCTPHGFRSLFSTALNELGRPFDTIEAALAHTDSNAIRAAYNRSTYVEQRRALMADWALILDLSARGISWDRIRIASEAGRPLESLERLP